MGSGKTTVGEAVAGRTGAPFHDLDTMIAEVAGRSIPEIFTALGEPEFRRLESEALPRALEPGAVAALGGGTPMVDSCWALVRQRSIVVWLDAPFDVLWDRVDGGRGRPLIAGRTRAEVEALFSSRLARYAEANHRIDAALPLERVVDFVAGLWLLR
jgi:shikimate kinase